MRRAGWGLIALVIAIVALLVVVHGWSGRGPTARAIAFQVPEGATLSSTARDLEKAGAIRSAYRFRLLARALGSSDPIKAGEYRIRAGQSAASVLHMLQSGKVMQRLVVVPEGWPAVLVGEALEHADGLTGAVPAIAEGSILPDSYAFDRGDTRASVIRRMQKAMTAYLAQAWVERRPGIPVTTPEQAIILASIVEKETGKPSERRLVAAVYGNRLRAGMPLQADPTVIYPITRGKPLGRRILLSELHAKNGYNTYAQPGLPVGPIANPGRASIDAVLDPEQSSALYFVADGSGGHVFANTLAEHNANVAKWREYRKVHGI